MSDLKIIGIASGAVEAFGGKRLSPPILLLRQVEAGHQGDVIRRRI